MHQLNKVGWLGALCCADAARTTDFTLEHAEDWFTLSFGLHAFIMCLFVSSLGELFAPALVKLLT